MSKNRPLTKKNYLLKIPFQLTISLTNLNKKKEIKYLHSLCTKYYLNISYYGRSLSQFPGLIYSFLQSKREKVKAYLTNKKISSLAVFYYIELVLKNHFKKN